MISVRLIPWGSSIFLTQHQAREKFRGCQSKDGTSLAKPLKINIKTKKFARCRSHSFFFFLVVMSVSHWRSSFWWQHCMLVAILEITEGERETERARVWWWCSEVTTRWYDVWNQSTPRRAPAEGPPLAKVRRSGQTLRHSLGLPPSTVREGKEAKLVNVTITTY